MASRGTFGFRSGKAPAERGGQRENVPVPPLRGSSLRTGPANTSKLPTQSSSFFSRSKRSVPKPTAPSNLPVGKTQALTNISSTKSEPGARTIGELPQNTGLGISTVDSFAPVQPHKFESSGKHVRNVLRRKATLDQRSGYARTESSASSHGPEIVGPLLETASSPEASRDPFAGSILGVPVPSIPSTHSSSLPLSMAQGSELATSSSRMANFRSRNVPQVLSMQNLPPPTPTYVHDSGSSTRRSESPGDFSRTSTPTSMSSQSPGVGAPVRAPSRTGQLSPARSRPPVTRRKFPGIAHQEEMNLSQSRGLTAVRESATSSSSSSTIKANERRDGSQVRSDRSTPLPPNSPTRQTSKRVIASYGEDHGVRPDALKEVPEQRSRNDLASQYEQGEHRLARSETPQFQRSNIPPPRPSREGTPRLDDAVEPSTVIRTYLPPLQTSGHRRRQSSEKDLSSAGSKISVPHSSRTPLGYSPSSASSLSVKPSRMPSPNLSVNRPPRSVPQDIPSHQVGPSVDTSIGNVRPTKEPSPISASSGKSSSRFGIFTKRTRSPLEISATDHVEKAAKKGPTAGTGHEGYGKYARRGRSGSVSTSASRGRSTSSNSAGRTSTSRKSSFTSRDEPVLDNFLRERLAPVVIPGGVSTTGDPIEGTSLQDTSLEDNASVTRLSEENVAKGHWLQHQAPMRSETTTAEPFDTHHLRRDYRRLPHRYEDPQPALEYQRAENPLDTAPTLAARRSAHRSQQFGRDTETLRLPAPIDTRAAANSSGHDDGDSNLSPLRTDSTIPISDDISEGREGNWLKSRKSRKRSRSPRKWNFFQRAQASPRRIPDAAVLKTDNDNGTSEELSATVSRAPGSRPVPFYALLDVSEQEVSDPIGNLHRLERVHADSNFPETSDATSPQESVGKLEHRMSSLLPTPPTRPTEFLSPQVATSHDTGLPPPQKAPTPISEHTPAPAPEPRKPRLQQVGRIPRVVSKRDREHKPPPQSFSRPFARRPLLGNESQSAPIPEQRTSVEGRKLPLGIQTETIPSDPWGDQGSAKPASAPIQQSSVFSGSTKDEFLTFPTRIGSEVSGTSSSGILSFDATTAIIPEPGTALAEDEVWNEYNEFLDTVGSSPAQLSIKSRNPHETTLQRGQPASTQIQKTTDPSATGLPTKLQISDLLASTAPTKPLPNPPDRSKILSTDFPSTPGTISDLVAGYGERNRSSGRPGSRSTTSRYSTSSIESELDSLAGREKTQEPNVKEAIITQSDPRPAVQSNLRFNALMTSRWLSFDRVLFSPAHTEVKSDRILILDGLGNDDWSFYCAETYRNADIFNLSPTSKQLHAGALELPNNHRQIQHPGLAARFPFPHDFFAAAVLRFPAATSEGAYLNAVSECMRVLRPGGYLEFSLLDLDMVNMGNKARKALRELKVRMQVAQPGVALKPLSDNMQKIVKRSGFENLNRCMVNVPVAGSVGNSRFGPVDMKSSSFEDLRKESSGKDDGGLAKILPTVGRWWFTRCYEMASMPYDDMERSIWNDGALLDECEKRETGFKLLLCYAQKPAGPDNTPSAPQTITRSKSQSQPPTVRSRQGR